MSLTTIPAKDIWKYIGEKNVVIIDMRSEEEYKEGHIETAINLPYNTENWDIDISQDKIIILYCDRGNVSLQIGRKLSRKGYNVISLYGGMNAYRGKVVVDYFHKI